MTKSELVAALSSLNPTLPKFDIEEVVNLVFDEITKTLKDEDRVELRGFGAFSTKKRAPRTARNPKTGESVNVDDKIIPYFKMGKELKIRINANKKSKIAL